MGNKFRGALEYLGLAEGSSAVEYDEAAYPPQPQEAPVVEFQEYQAPVTPIRAAVVPDYAPSYGTVADLHRITTIHPRSYNDARLIGEAFRNGVPVIINLSDMGADEAKRLVDFASGLIFGLNGGIERVTGRVFLLSPEHVEVIGEDAVVAEAGGAPEAIGGQFYNQS